MNVSELREGMKVRSADGTSLGKIIQIGSDEILVEKGFFFPKDYAIRAHDVSEIRDDEVWLSTRDDALRGGDDFWHGSTETGTTAGAASLGTERERSSYGASSTEETRMPLMEEELTAEKRQREGGEVRVRKEVVTEHKTINVPVTREEVHVERVAASSSSTPDKDAFQEKTISVPVMEEEVEIRKRPRVKEEVRVSKTRHQVEQRADAEVRREEAKIDDTTTRTDKSTWGSPLDDDDKKRGL